MNVQKILVPVDYSSCSDAAMAHAVSLARDYDASIHLVHVFEPPTGFVDAGFAGAPIPAEITPADLEEEEAKLERVASADGTSLSRKLVTGNPADALLNYAEENEIDLIVMGTHGRTGLGRLLMGSVAEAVVRRSTCPVLTFKQTVEKLKAKA